MSDLVIEQIFDQAFENGPRFPARPPNRDVALGDPHARERVDRARLLSDGWLAYTLPNYGVARLDHTDAGATIEPEVEDPLVGAIRGEVSSARGPVAGAEVIVYSTFYQRHARYDRSVEEVGRTVTDGYGVFDLRPIGLDTVHFGADGELFLTIRCAGYGAIVGRRVNEIQPERENDLGSFVLEPDAQVLQGTIRDRAGRPVVGAAVRVSGQVNPVRYDKTERMVILKDCPTAVTDEEGRYRLTGFAPGDQMASIHVNVDCVLRRTFSFWAGPIDWNPHVLAGCSVRGVVLDPEGRGVAAAVVSGGGNWTPTNADGTFWLDNVEEGPFEILVAHHEWRSLRVPDVTASETEEREIQLAERLPRIALRVLDAEDEAPVPLVAIYWKWAEGRPHPFLPESVYWHAADGRYDVVVPEGATSAHVSAEGFAGAPLAAEDLADGREVTLRLVREAASPADSAR